VAITTIGESAVVVIVARSSGGGALPRAQAAADRAVELAVLLLFETLGVRLRSSAAKRDSCFLVLVLVGRPDPYAK
jgi:hypothetical protein